MSVRLVLLDVLVDRLKDGIVRCTKAPSWPPDLHTHVLPELHGHGAMSKILVELPDGLFGKVWVRKLVRIERRAQHHVPRAPVDRGQRVSGVVASSFDAYARRGRRS